MKKRNKKAQTEDIFADFGISLIIIIIGIYVLSHVGGAVKHVEQTEEAIQEYLYKDVLDVTTYLRTEIEMEQKKISFADALSTTYYKEDKYRKDLEKGMYGSFLNKLDINIPPSDQIMFETGALCYKVTVKYPTQEEFAFQSVRIECTETPSQFVFHDEKDKIILPLYNYKTAEVILSSGSGILAPNV